MKSTTTKNPFNSKLDQHAVWCWAAEVEAPLRRNNRVDAGSVID